MTESKPEYTAEHKPQVSEYHHDMEIRRIGLEYIDLIERRWGMSPRTAELRKRHKQERLEGLTGKPK